MKINFKVKTNHTQFIKEYLASLGYKVISDGKRYVNSAIRGPYEIYAHPNEKMFKYQRVCLSDLDLYMTNQGALSTNSDVEIIKDFLSNENLNIPL